ncbi:MAG: hypothetical protein AAF264_03220 [Pseudomonadota bacterium]
MDTPSTSNLGALCRALAHHARRAAEDIERLEEALSKRLPVEEIEGALLVEMQSLDQVGQAMGDLARLLDCLALQPRDERTGETSVADVLTAAKLMATRDAIADHLQHGLGVGDANSRLESRHNASPGSVDFF